MANKEKILEEEEVAKSRREFLKRAGKYALYTPPAVMLLMKPSHATFRKSGGYVGRYHKDGLDGDLDGWVGKYRGGSNGDGMVPPNPAWQRSDGHKGHYYANGSNGDNIMPPAVWDGYDGKKHDYSKIKILRRRVIPE